MAKISKVRFMDSNAVVCSAYLKDDLFNDDALLILSISGCILKLSSNNSVWWIEDTFEDKYSKSITIDIGDLCEFVIINDNTEHYGSQHLLDLFKDFFKEVIVCTTKDREVWDRRNSFRCID